MMISKKQERPHTLASCVVVYNVIYIISFCVQILPHTHKRIYMYMWWCDVTCARKVYDIEISCGHVMNIRMFKVLYHIWKQTRTHTDRQTDIRESVCWYKGESKNNIGTPHHHSRYATYIVQNVWKHKMQNIWKNHITYYILHVVCRCSRWIHIMLCLCIFHTSIDHYISHNPKGRWKLPGWSCQ